MNTIAKHILKAVLIESIGAVLLASAFYALFFSFAETMEFSKILWFPILAGFFAMCFAGIVIGNSFSQNFKFKVWHGVAIIFVLLIIAIVIGVIATLFIPNWDSFDIIQGAISVILIFLSFGGLPTLLTGIWLGYRLKNKF
ncbi:MAG: hypothetical protein EOO96_18055 [Pedobacter sp.]|nr:MAG: hypothetical protein EOO96_18055 [Pedobacter sp.]